MLARVPEIQQTQWYHDGWLRETLQRTPEESDRAFTRWRELYIEALNQQAAASAQLQRQLSRSERQDAEDRNREAERTLRLLLNDATDEESDIRHYRDIGEQVQSRPDVFQPSH